MKIKITKKEAELFKGHLIDIIGKEVNKLSKARIERILIGKDSFVVNYNNFLEAKMFDK